MQYEEKQTSFHHKNFLFLDGDFRKFRISADYHGRSQVRGVRWIVSVDFSVMTPLERHRHQAAAQLSALPLWGSYDYVLYANCFYEWKQTNSRPQPGTLPSKILIKMLVFSQKYLYFRKNTNILAKIPRFRRFPSKPGLGARALVRFIQAGRIWPFCVVSKRSDHCSMTKTPQTSCTSRSGTRKHPRMDTSHFRSQVSFRGARLKLFTGPRCCYCGAGSSLPICGLLQTIVFLHNS